MDDGGSSDLRGIVPDGDAPDRTALSADVEHQLGELAGTLGWLADDLEAGYAVRPVEAWRAAERASAAVDAVRFVEIVERLGE